MYGSEQERRTSRALRCHRIVAGRRSQVGAARGWAAQRLRGVDRADDVLLAVSELVTNAIVHSRSGAPGGWARLHLRRWPTGVEVRVADLGAADRPQRAAASECAESGRGMALVTAVADEWGTQETPYGLTVWARFSTAGDAR
ncbi:anti-sigma regulatory factor (Ser/Thr protein kinase) [Spinactinospora alkalitolerans]|uniref:Anti-sigma regulatory factor (Ser/Thr protein kinase) n=1 Tax=Spinactinospora alkalitolerans TaxID=687207 RepID=A0A852TZE4_9ACTN|nr:ATP-binding protein [Spinactinospora alkalitolerans]NYE49298.1 anti-sigma regulatory factor (Ser/Thr protein kinase) [Spinactinospora alkalitolerans]